MLLFAAVALRRTQIVEEQFFEDARRRTFPASELERLGVEATPTVAPDRATSTAPFSPLARASPSKKPPPSSLSPLKPEPPSHRLNFAHSPLKATAAPSPQQRTPRARAHALSFANTNGDPEDPGASTGTPPPKAPLASDLPGPSLIELLELSASRRRDAQLPPVSPTGPHGSPRARPYSAPPRASASTARGMRSPSLSPSAAAGGAFSARGAFAAGSPGGRWVIPPEPPEPLRELPATPETSAPIMLSAAHAPPVDPPPVTTTRSARPAAATPGWPNHAAAREADDDLFAAIGRLTASIPPSLPGSRPGSPIRGGGSRSGSPVRGSPASRSPAVPSHRPPPHLASPGPSCATFTTATSIAASTAAAAIASAAAEDTAGASSSTLLARRGGAACKQLRIAGPADGAGNASGAACSSACSASSSPSPSTGGGQSSLASAARTPGTTSPHAPATMRKPPLVRTPTILTHGFASSAAKRSAATQPTSRGGARGSPRAARPPPWLFAAAVGAAHAGVAQLAARVSS